MRISTIAACIGGTLLVGFTAARTDVHPVAPQAVAALPPLSSALIAGDYLVAAPGRVEPGSEEIRVSASTTGLIREVLVKEGDRVHRGDVIARIEADDLAAAVARAEAQLKLARAQLLLVMNGARPAEREAAYAAVGEMEAVEKYAAAELARRRALTATGASSRQALDQAEQEYTIAVERHLAALRKYALVNDPPREEDVAIATSRLAAAKSALDEAKAALDKAVVRSPIDGTVLRVQRRPGELVSTFFVDQPIVVIGDLSKLVVRAEVDEADIAKVETGLAAYVTADAYGTTRFTGKLVHVGEMLGQKKVHTGDPTERADTRVLEVLIDLDPGSPLRPGLRVNSFITRPALSQR